MSSRRTFIRLVILFAMQIPSLTAAGVCKSNPPLVPPNCNSITLEFIPFRSIDLTNITFKNLMIIYFVYNGLTEMPRLSQSSKATLRTMTIIHNKVTYFPKNYFNGFWRLWKLHLYGNRFSYMPEMPDSAKKRIKHFRINSNKISEIPAGYFSGFSELINLDLSRNLIMRLPQNISIGHLKLRNLYIDQMICDCDTLLAWKEIATINMHYVRAFSRRTRKPVKGQYPCVGNLGRTKYWELGTNACASLSSTGPPSTTDKAENSIPLIHSGIEDSKTGSLVTALVLCCSSVVLLCPSLACIF